MNAYYTDPPDFIPNTINYFDRLNRMAKNIRARDKRRWENLTLTQADYREMIHQAIVNSIGRCYYTGDFLHWNTFGLPFQGDTLQPTIDHFSLAPNIQLVVSSWAANDAKSNLSYEAFVILCRKIIHHYDRPND